MIVKEGMKKIPIAGCVAAVAAAASVLSADEVQMKAQRVSLFKNGYACVQMSGELPQGTQVEMKGLPMPVFGTLDWSVPEGVRVAHFEARKTEPVGMQALPAAVLRSCVGRAVTLTTPSKREYCGVVLAPAPLQKAPMGSFCTDEEEGMLPQVNAETVVLRTARGGIVALPAGLIAGVVAAEGAAELPTPRPAAAEICVRLAEPAAGKPLQVDMVTQGLSWLPTYRLDLQQGGQAHLAGNVAVINRLMDLDGVELELITGHPALGEGLVTSPMVRLVGLRKFLQALERNKDWLPETLRREFAGDIGYVKHAVMRDAEAVRQEYVAFDDCAYDMEVAEMQAAPAMPSGASASYGDGGMGLLGGMNGGSTSRAEDLTYYTVPSFSSKCGETVECELFSVTVPCRHVYTCDLPDQRVMQAAARSEGAVADIWHCVRLKNDGKLPWSMGVVSCSAEGRFAARSLLPFTAVGQESLLRLSKALETTVTCREELLSSGSRGENKPDVYRGQIQLTNHSDRPMDMELTKAVIGQPTEASDAGQISVTPAYSGNPRASVSWKLHLKPQESKTCSYTYQYLND